MSKTNLLQRASLVMLALGVALVALAPTPSPAQAAGAVTGMDDLVAYRVDGNGYGKFYFDTAHNGGNGELELSLGYNDLYPLMGNVDGNSNDDPCVARQNFSTLSYDFLCDTAHNGGNAEMTVSVYVGEWLSFAAPLMGDVNDDGKDDPCFFLGNDDPGNTSPVPIACETARNGGSPEFNLEFGIANSDWEVLIGDIDGSGNDDICVARHGFDPESLTFLCDTAHNGGYAEVSINFGQVYDDPLLGDINGDGKDDPCVVRANLTNNTNTVYCDTIHNGGYANVQLVFGQVNDNILLGNIDGRGDYSLYRFYSSAYQTHFYTSSVSEKNALLSNPSWTYEGAWNKVFNQQEYGSVPVYRLYRNGTQKRFYTTSLTERNNLIASGGWTYEWIAFYVYPSQKTGTVGVRRFYKPSSQAHFYTSNSTEITSLRNSGQWVDEGIVWYAPN